MGYRGGRNCMPARRLSAAIIRTSSSRLCLPARVSRVVRRTVLLIYGALVRLSGRAPRCVIEPFLTVGLVPRIATRLVATHNSTMGSV